MTKIRPSNLPSKRTARKFEPPEGVDPDSPMEVWAVGSFFVLHNRESEISTIVDVLRRAMIQFSGTIDETLDVAQALANTKSRGKLVFSMDDVPTDPDQFLTLGIAAIADYNDTMMSADDDDMDADTIFKVGRSSLLDELIKPPQPKKKD